MIITKDSAPFIQDYITSLNEILKSHSQGQELSRLQSMWLQFVILGMLEQVRKIWLTRIWQISIMLDVQEC